MFCTLILNILSILVTSIIYLDNVSQCLLLLNTNVAELGRRDEILALVAPRHHHVLRSLLFYRYLHRGCFLLVLVFNEDVEVRAHGSELSLIQVCLRRFLGIRPHRVQLDKILWHDTSMVILRHLGHPKGNQLHGRTIQEFHAIRQRK